MTIFALSRREFSTISNFLSAWALPMLVVCMTNYLAFLLGLFDRRAGFALPLEDLYLALVYYRAHEPVGKFLKLSADGLARLTIGIARFYH